MVIAIYLVILVGAFYFLIVRPQRRQSMIRRQLLNAVDVGDEIITSGGIYGTVISIDEDSLEVLIAEGIVIKLARGAVAAKVGPDAPDDDPAPTTDGDRSWPRRWSPVCPASKPEVALDTTRHETAY